jgi:prevent-host-death family protein
MVRIIKASEFKAKCLALLDEVERGGDSIVITKRGRQVACVSRVQPASQRPWLQLIGGMEGTCEIVGDLVAPTTSPDDWDCD